MIELKFAFTAQLQLAPWRPYGTQGNESRRLVEIKGGKVAGPRLNGTVLLGGADWPRVYPNGILRFDARWTIETADKTLVYVQNTGIRRAAPEAHEKLDRNESVDPGLVYFRTAPVFETAASDYQWMTQSLFIATGRRGANALDLDVYEVL